MRPSRDAVAKRKARVAVDNPPPASATASASASAASVSKRPTISPEDLKPFKPLPAAMESDKNPITDDKVTLGRMLYFEKRPVQEPRRQL